MAFKDNVGVTEELKVELVECGPLDPAPEGVVRTYVFEDLQHEIVWMTRNGEVIKIERTRLEK